jgi:glycosyltransferase involved in cell wall biosynthesis
MTALNTSLSIVIPSFNAEKTIKETLESIISQGEHVEIVVQDGMSKDKTLEIISEFERHVRLFSESDQGQSDALNKGISRSSGDLVGWLNADDIYMPGSLQQVLRVAEMHPEIDVFYGDHRIIDGEGNLIREYHVSDWTGRNAFTNGINVWSGSIFFRRRVFDDYGLFDTSLSYCMDLEFLMRISQSVKAMHIPSVLAAFRVHEASKTGSQPLKFLPECHRVRWQYAGNNWEFRLHVLRKDARQFLYTVSRRLWMSNAIMSRRGDKSV